MTYNSGDVNSAQVARFKSLLLEHLEGFWDSEILLAYAAALEEAAPEVREKAIERQVAEAAKNQLY
jgi:hypothetical protein